MTETSFRYDPYKLHNDLADIGTYLADLHYIDQVFAYLAGLQSSWWHAITPGQFHFAVDFGGTVPFRRVWDVPEHFIRRLPWQDSKEEEIRAQIQRYADTAPTWASCNIETVRAMMEPLAHPTTAGYLNDLIRPVQDVLNDLQDGVNDDFAKLRHTLGRWEGAAADQFANNFYHPFADTLDSQERLLIAFLGGLATSHTIVEATQQSLMNVVHHIREALHEQLQLRAQEAAAARQQSVKEALIVTGTTIAVASTVGSGLWPPAAGATSAALNLGAGTLSGDIAVGHKIAGTTADELLSALVAAISRIDSNAHNQYVDLETNLNGVLTRVNELRNGSSGPDGRLIPIRPHIVDGVDGSNWRLPLP
nr:hypothetical protein [Micromonospora sp. DSM 115978]